MDILAKLGFSSGEGKVYFAIAASDQATLQFVHEQTGFERRSVYDIINKLVSKGLVAYHLENGHKIYHVNHPGAFMAYLEDEAKRVEEKKQALAQELPQLLKTYQASKSKFDVRIYRGKEGIKALFNEMLDYKDHYCIGGNWGVIGYVGKPWWDRWMDKRERRGVWMHDILVPDVKLMSAYPAPKKLYESRVLPPEFGSPNVIFIFGNRVVNLFWGQTPFAFQIENDEIAQNYLAYFKYLWKTLDEQARVFYGFEGMIAAHERLYSKLKRGDDYYYLNIPARQPARFHDYWKKDHERRASAGIIGKLLFDRKTDAAVLKNRNSYPGSHARYMPIEVKSPVWFFGYKDVAVIVAVSDTPVTIEITNQQMADAFRSYFEQMWAKSKPFR